MRNNQPVTQKEYKLPKGALLVSYTDLAGTITEANEAFVAASGYAFDEIMGQPHNILRHPDVPEQVFADFWATIKAGRPWRNIVKNRRKNGDHYWVEANATPIMDNGQITGYMSVRTPATDAQIKEAEQAYALVAQGKAKLRYGEVDSFSKHWNPLAHWNPMVTILPATGFAIGTELTAYFLGIRPDWLNEWVIFLTILANVHIWYFINRIKDAIGAIDGVANGRLNEFINTDGENTSGVINRRIKTMQIRLGAQQNEINFQARRSARLEAGLDNLNAYIMLADQNGTITYFNESLADYLQTLEPAIQKEVPDFVVNKLLGKNVACLLAKNMDILNAVMDLKTSEQFQFEFFGANLQLQMSPIFSANGQQKLGVVIEWQDIYQELFVQESIKKIVMDGKDGKLHSRIVSDDLTGFYKELADEINDFMTNLQMTLTDISVVIGGLSEKDLTVKPSRSYQGQYDWTIGNLISGLNSLRASYCSVTNQSTEVMQSANHVANSNEELSDSIKNQETILKQTSGLMQQLVQKVSETSEQAQISTQIAQKTQSEVEQGNQSMNEAIQAMHEITEVSHQINGIVTLIDSIAFQTNLLALNAAVEAARAGEHGRGFAVVAGEVRNLAQKSAEAANDIKALIGQTTEKIGQGTQKVETTGQALNGIISQVGEMTTNISVITENAHEQASQIQTVNESIRTLDKAAKHNAALILENASLADYLGEVAQNMDELVGAFELGDCNEVANLISDDQNMKPILVVDDNISNQKVASMVLNKMGYNTKLANNGQEAIIQASRYHPAAILMDIEMPIKDGLQATEELRRSNFTAPIIAYSGHAEGNKEICDKIKQVGMNGFVHKPLKPEVLKETLISLGCQPDTRNSQAVIEARKQKIANSPQAQQFQKMIDAHLAWKARIRKFIDGADIGVKYEAAIDHKACILGQWYYGQGQSLIHLPAMTKLGQEHEQLHGLIKTIMDAASVDDYEMVKSGIKQLDLQSDKVVELLNELIDTQS